MISTGQIFTAAAVTAIAVAVAAAALRWSLPALAAAALLSFAVIVVWRTISNLTGLNGDYLPALSVGDTGCLIAGALGPALVAGLPWFGSRTRRLPAVVRGGPRPAVSGRGLNAAAWSDWVPPLVGGIVGFVINVLIL